jgi:choline dehydrogenase-like flavoprotein
VLANRLSADPLNKVLILEEGGDPNPFAKVPATYHALAGVEPYSKSYQTATQENACLNTDKVRHAYRIEKRVEICTVQ